MNIKPGLPYKIAKQRIKKYAAHYNISPDRCLVVPLKLFGNEASCEVRWEDDNGELFLLQNKFFVCENLVPLNSMLEPKLDELWQHYYDSGLSASAQPEPGQKQTDPTFFNQ
jgi:hypothetical protein